MQNVRKGLADRCWTAGPSPPRLACTRLSRLGCAVGRALGWATLGRTALRSTHLGWSVSGNRLPGSRARALGGSTALGHGGRLAIRWCVGGRRVVVIGTGGGCASRRGATRERRVGIACWWLGWAWAVGLHWGRLLVTLRVLVVGGALRGHAVLRPASLRRGGLAWGGCILSGRWHLAGVCPIVLSVLVLVGRHSRGCSILRRGCTILAGLSHVWVTPRHVAVPCCVLLLLSHVLLLAVPWRASTGDQLTAEDLSCNDIGGSRHDSRFQACTPAVEHHADLGRVHVLQRLGIHAM
mmetsp:Transcript_18683/g.31831  ORF Transcript_18683/g.31831 Transcript_18683/m.31831 type:complete len:295 (-) Transcript_18683:629-1513(-)